MLSFYVLANPQVHPSFLHPGTCSGCLCARHWARLWDGPNEVLRSCPLGVFCCLSLHSLLHTKRPPHPHTHTALCSGRCLAVLSPLFSLPSPLSLLCDHSVVQELTLVSECVRLYAILRPQHFAKTWWRILPNPKGWGLSNLSLGPTGCLGARLSEPATELAGTYAVNRCLPDPVWPDPASTFSLWGPDLISPMGCLEVCIPSSM